MIAKPVFVWWPALDDLVPLCKQVFLGVWQWVAVDPVKFHPGFPCPTLLCRTGGPPPQTALKPFQGWPTWRAGSLWPSTTILNNPRLCKFWISRHRGKIYSIFSDIEFLWIPHIFLYIILTLCGKYWTTMQTSSFYSKKNQTFFFQTMLIFIQQLAIHIDTAKKFVTYSALPNAERSLHPTPEVIEDSYCAVSENE